MFKKLLRKVLPEFLVYTLFIVTIFFIYNSKAHSSEYFENEELGISFLCASSEHVLNLATADRSSEEDVVKLIQEYFKERVCIKLDGPLKLKVYRIIGEFKDADNDIGVIVSLYLEDRDKGPIAYSILADPNKVKHPNI
jgi:hypothetical protein